MDENIPNQIKFKITKSSVFQNELISFYEAKDKQEKLKAICSFCGHDIYFFKNYTKQCEMCASKHFLIENSFAIISVIGKGGFGKIYKALHLNTGKKRKKKKKNS